MSANRAYIVGVGPGSANYLTGEAEKAIREAGIIVGWDLDLLPVKSLIADKKVYTQDVSNYVPVAQAAAEEAKKSGEVVAVLRIGDPCISSGLSRLLEILHGFEVKIVPGISSIQLAAAAGRINIDESVVISFHDGGDVERKRRFMLEALRHNRHLIILTGPDLKPEEAAGYLLSNGAAETTPTVVCENLALPEERIFQGTLKDIVAEQFSWLSVTVVLCQAGRRTK